MVTVDKIISVRSDKMNRKKKGIGHKLLSAMLTIVLLTGMVPQSVHAENVLIDTQIISESINEASTASVDVDAITIEKFLWPNENGQYTYTYLGAEDNKRYMILVIPGVHKTLSGMNADDLITQLVYIDQKTASEGKAEFIDFMPAYDENCTIIIAGEGIQASIVGYISKDIFNFGVYTTEENSNSIIDDSITIPKNITYEELKNTLPKQAYMEVYSDYVDSIYVPVNLLWRDCENFQSNKIGKINRIIADVSVGEKYSNSELAKVTKPFVVNAIVEDTISVPCALTATKQKVIYDINETVTDEDIRVKALYTDGTIHNATGWTTDVSSISTSVAGVQYITITYNYESIVLETKVPINVVDSSTGYTKFYQINFDTFGGSYIPACIIAEGEKLELHQTPVKSGFVFEGWYTDRYRKNPYDMNSVVDKNMTLYAGWRDVNESALYDVRAYLSNYVFIVGTVLSQDMITVQAVYDNGDTKEIDTYTHNLDSIDQTKTGVKTLSIEYTEGKITRNCEVEFRVVEQNTHQLYTVTFETGCEQTIAPQIVAEGECVTAPLNNLKRQDYVFSGWYANGVRWDFAKNKITKDTVLTAKWLKKYGSDTEIYSYVDENLIYEYTGKAVKPNVVIMDKYLNVLQKNKDYTVKYINNKKLSTESEPAKIIVTGKGNYEGSIEIDFNIIPKDIADEKSVVIKLSQYNAYKESGYSPLPTIKYSGKSLKKEKDFAVSYVKLSSYNSETGVEVKDSTLTDSGYYMVTVTGQGNYKGTRNIPFMIASSDLTNINKAKIKFADKNAKNVIYTGSEANIGNLITVTIGKETLKQGTDYEVVYPENNIDIGKKIAYVKALPTSKHCFGEKSFTYNISGVALKSAKVNLINKKMDYKACLIGNNIENVTIKLNANTAKAVNMYHKKKMSAGDMYTLMPNIDYTVAYKNNEKAGKATVILNGKGLFEGKLQKKFTINKIKLNSDMVSVALKNDSVKQNKSGAVVNLNVVYATGERNISLKEGRDYKVTYSKNKAVGDKAVATIKGIGNYTGSVKMNFTIVPKSLSSSDINVSLENPVQSANNEGYIYRPKIIVKDGKEALKDGKDYTIDYSGCVTQKMVNEGKSNGYIILREKENGSYNGMKIMPYQVLSNSIADKDCKIVISDCIYTGKPIEFNFDNAIDCSVFKAEIQLDNGQKVSLIPGQDFEVTGYSKNTNVGTAKVTISGIGDFTGTKTVSFKIVKQEL